VVEKTKPYSYSYTFLHKYTTYFENTAVYYLKISPHAEGMSHE